MGETLDRLRREALRRFATDPERHGFVGDGGCADWAAINDIAALTVQDAARTGAHLEAFRELWRIAEAEGFPVRHDAAHDDELTAAEYATALICGAAWHAATGWLLNHPGGLREAAVDLGRAMRE